MSAATTDAGALQALAANLDAVDAELSSADASAGGQGGAPADAAARAAAEAEKAAAEHAGVSGALCLAAGVAGKVLPTIAKAYDSEACGVISTEYLRCAELYGWTFHRVTDNPVLGLVIASALPAVMHLEGIRADVRALREPAKPAQAAQLTDGSGQ